MPALPASAAPDAPPPATLPAILWVFLKLGMASFGGGLSGWIYGEVVDRRRWIAEDAFLAGMAVCQVLPGPNAVNLALYVGQQLRGLPGAAAAGIGILGPPFGFILFLAVLHAWLAGLPGLGFVLGGVAAAGIANSCYVGLRTARRMRGVAPWAVTAATFVAVGVLRLPMLPVVLVVIPLSVALAWHTRHAA